MKKASALSYREIITTDKELCVGCNKCVAECVVKANIAFQYNGENKIKVDQGKCIHCGACIRVCDHNARSFADDTVRFFNDLRRGLSISMIVAPSVRFNFPRHRNLYGYLKSLGIRQIYDVSLGADIAVWAYLKMLDEKTIASIIAQPCSVIVNYVQKYRPELIPQLAAVHSPMMCTAIYLKKYKMLSHRIAFLSPCIGKIDEINEKSTERTVSYNITLEKLEQYLQEHSVDLDKYQEVSYDSEDSMLGFLFSRIGGLKENIEFYRKDIWIRQVDGIREACEYLDDYSHRLKEGKLLPRIIDILNCRNGCNFGTAANKHNLVDDIDYAMNNTKKCKIQSQAAAGQGQENQKSFILFDQMLHMQDFKREYEDKSKIVANIADGDIAAVFEQMHKKTEASRNINCYSCGYGNCHDFAKAVAHGENHIGNCADFNRKELIRKNARLLKTNQDIKQLHYLATHDFLTNIPNRYYLEEYLGKLIADIADDPQQSALFFIDLDNFKVVNDSFGHASGDQILIRLADCLQMHLGQDTFLARLGGDEFAAVLKGANLEEARNVANKLLQTLWTEDFDFTEHHATVNVTASIGIVMIDGTQDTQALFSHADIALYTAKAEGKNRIFVIEPHDSGVNLLQTNQIILQLYDALKEDRFVLNFQPVFKNDGKILHYEALLRMLDSEGKMVYPNHFMPVAERFGLMSKIDRWVVSAALDVLNQYSAISVFVNISAASLGDAELLKFIETAIKKSNVSPCRIGFEITETAAIRDLNHAEHWIHRLHLIGCRFALDDFGAGFLSFLHLQRLPVDYLKIDGSLIYNLETEQNNRELVKAMIVVAHALGKETIAEYVENETIWEILHGLQIDCGQGYFLGRPLPLPEALGLAGTA